MLTLNKESKIKLIYFFTLITFLSICIVSSCGLPKEPKHEYSQDPYMLTGATSISTGGFQSCALLNDRSVRCWGKNDVGQLGNDTNINNSFATYISGISNAIFVSVGYYHICTLLTNNSIQCWGENSDGQLGDGSNTRNSTPVDVSGISTATAISAGNNHTCALLATGSAP